VEIWDDSLRHNIPTFINETEILGMDHGEIGGYTIRRWNMAAPVVQAVMYHHQPTRTDHAYVSCAQVIHVADRICSFKDVGSSRDSIEVEGLTDEILGELGLDIDRIPSLREEARMEMSRSDVVLSLSGKV
jgi:HD-like signal output (HDOD) protein